MTPNKKPREYIIMDKSSGHVIHEGADRRSILPNESDFRTQTIVTVIGVFLTASIVFIGYCGDKAYSGITTSIADLKASNEDAFQKIWTSMNVGKSNRDNQFNWIMQECCQNAKVPPPISTP